MATIPGIQSRAEWTEMLAQSMDAGIPFMAIFEPEDAELSVLDAWDEILGGVNAYYSQNIVRYQTTSPHMRNRQWRNRRLWRR